MGRSAFFGQRGGVGLFLWTQKSPAPALQLMHVAVQGKQTYKGDDVPVGLKLEFGVSRDENEAKNGSGDYEAHASQEQYDMGQPARL